MSRTTSTGDGRADQAWCRVQEVNGCAVVSAFGAFDTNSAAQELRDATQVSAEFSNRVAIGLREVQSFDSVAHGVRVRALSGRARAEQGAITVVATDRIGMRISMMGQVPTRPSLEAALSDFTGSSA